MTNVREGFRLSEFAEFLNDDESDGHRLAEFLQCKRGKVFPKRVFDEKDADNFDVTVHVERLQPPAPAAPPAVVVASPEKQAPPQEQRVEAAPQVATAAEEAVVAVESPPRCSADVMQNLAVSPEAGAPIPRQRLSSLRKSGGIISSADRLRRSVLQRSSGRRVLLKEFENTINSMDFIPPVCSTPMTTPSTTDKLAEPPMVVIHDQSTRHSSATSQNDEPTSPINNSSQLMQDLQRRDEDLRAMLENVVETTLKKVNDELEKSQRESATPSPPSPSSPPKTPPRSVTQRSYTLERGPLAGQVLLTPTRPSTSAALPAAIEIEVEERATSPVSGRPPLHCSPRSLESPKRGSISVKSPLKLLADPKKNAEFKRAYGLQSPTETTTKKNKPSQIPRKQGATIGSTHKNIAAPSTYQAETFIAATQELAADAEKMSEDEEEDIEIPETQEQELPAETQRLVQAAVLQRRRQSEQQQQQAPIIVMPLTQTFNGVLPPEQLTMTIEAQNNTYTIKQQQKPQQTLNETTQKSTPEASVTIKEIAKEPKKKTSPPKPQPQHMPEDELRLTDILTDDEDEPVIAAVAAKRKLVNKETPKLVNKETPKQPPKLVNKDSQKRPPKSTSSSLLVSAPPSLSNTLDDAAPAESSNVALNLVASDNKNQRTRRLRKRSTVRRRSPVDQTLLSTETETEMGPPRAHPLNLRRSDRQIDVNRDSRRHLQPLNKAPSSPINGEKFAGELKTHLARLTNYEILDLRKRNSLGRVFPAVALKKNNAASRRQSTRAQQQNAIDQRLQLEEEIQLEILKRNLQGNNDGLDAAGDAYEEQCTMVVESDAVADANAVADSAASAADYDIFAELAPAPPVAFMDSGLTPEEEALRALLTNAENTSLLDGGSGDCVTFVPPPSAHRDVSRRKGKRKAAKVQSEVVRNYLDVTKKISRKSRSKSSANNTKRSLYTKGHSDSEETNSSLEKDRNDPNSSGEQAKSPPAKLPAAPLPIVPPPPPSSSINSMEMLHNVRAVSPPPPMDLVESPPGEVVAPPMEVESPPSTPPSRRRRSSKVVAAAQKQVSPEPPPLVLLPPPPPPALFSDQSKANAEAAAIDDDAVFKKPTQPAPKLKRGRKPKATPAAEQHSDTATTSGLDTSLRRSKRGHVPLKNTWSFRTNDPTSLFTIMLREQLQKSEENSRKRLEKLKQQQKAAKAEAKKNKLPPSKTKPQQQQQQQHGETLPIASSTANSYSAALTNETTKTKKKYARTERNVPPLLPQYSYLGDTRASSLNTSSASSMRGSARDLSPIYEPEGETNFEGDVPMEEEPIVAPITPLTARSTAASNSPPTTSSAAARSVPPTVASTATSADKAKAKPSKKKQQQQEEKEKEPQPKQPEAATKPKKSKTKSENKQKSVLEHSRIALTQPPVDKLNDIFDELKRGANPPSPLQQEMPAASTKTTTTTATTNNSSSSSMDSNNSVKKLRVRLQRLNLPIANSSADRAAAASTSSTTTPTVVAPSTSLAGKNTPVANMQKAAAYENTRQSEKNNTCGSELLLWLKGISDIQTSSENNLIFQTMHCSAAGNLRFTDLEGIDYAFYDTDDKASLGYLRFKPKQFKSAKRAKKYHLHFIVLSGEFKIGTNKEIGSFSTGDMIAINKGARYTIENASDDISLLMVVKK